MKSYRLNILLTYLKFLDFADTSMKHAALNIHYIFNRLIIMMGF